VATWQTIGRKKKFGHQTLSNILIMKETQKSQQKIRFLCPSFGAPEQEAVSKYPAAACLPECLFALPSFFLPDACAPQILEQIMTQTGAGATGH
jgi:hypothetical protein